MKPYSQAQSVAMFLRNPAHYINGFYHLRGMFIHALPTIRKALTEIADVHRGYQKEIDNLRHQNRVLRHTCREMSAALKPFHDQVEYQRGKNGHGNFSYGGEPADPIDYRRAWAKHLICSDYWRRDRAHAARIAKGDITGDYNEE